MTFPICSNRTPFDGLNHTSFGASTSIVGTSGDGQYRPVRQTQDGRLVFQPQAPAADFYALLKTVHACFRGVTDPVYRIAASLMRGIGPTMADAARIGSPGIVFDAALDARVEDAISAVPILFTGTGETASEALRLAALERLGRISNNLRNELRIAAADHPDTAAMLEEGLRRVAIKVVTPEFSPVIYGSLVKDGSVTSYAPSTGSFYIGADLDGLHAATTFIGQFSRIREYHRPEILTTREYHPQMLVACHDKIRETVFTPVESCLAHGDLSRQDCIDALRYEPSFRLRTQRHSCENSPVESPDGVVMGRVLRSPHDPASDNSTVLAFRQVGGPTICVDEPAGIMRHGGPLTPLNESEARLFKMVMSKYLFTPLSAYKNSHSPQHLGAALHANFVREIPGDLARRLCPELYESPPVVARESGKSGATLGPSRGRVK